MANGDKAGNWGGIAWGSAILAAAMAVIAGICAYVVLFNVGRDTASTGTLAASLLFGVLTFFFALGSLVSIFHAVGLDNEKYALGMPRGSVRAFMALVLIMLFFLMSVFLYLDVAGSTTEETIEGVTEEQLVSLRSAGTVLEVNPVTGADGEVTDPPTFDVRVAVQEEGTNSQVAQDLARQLVTVLGTLIVAIAAFYFGSNSVQAARDRMATEEIVEGDAARLVEAAVEKDAARLIEDQIKTQVEPRLESTESGVQSLRTEVEEIQRRDEQPGH